MLTRRRLIVVAAAAAGAVVVALLSRRKGEPVGQDRKPDILAGLARLGPLPDDDAVTQAQLDEFSDLIGWIELAPPDPDYVRPLLATFGYGDGFGLYVHGANALLRQDRAAVVEAALDTLEAGRDGPRQWAMETLRRMREGDRGDPPPSAREVRAVEAALPRAGAGRLVGGLLVLLGRGQRPGRPAAARAGRPGCAREGSGDRR